MFSFQVSLEMINFYDSVYDKAVTQTFSDQEKKKAVATVLKVFHETVWTHANYLHKNLNEQLEVLYLITCLEHTQALNGCIIA